MMNDFVGNYFTPAHLREWTMAANFVASVFIGPYLAFAATPGAGLKCLQAFVRLFHRWSMVAFSIALMYHWGLIVANAGYVPNGAVMALSVLVLVMTVCSAVRFLFWMQDIPNGASWRHPHFAHRRIWS
jgi:hypothetical protein